MLLYPMYLVHCSEMFNELSKTDKMIISFKTPGYNILLLLNIGWDVAYFSYEFYLDFGSFVTRKENLKS